MTSSRWKASRWGGLMSALVVAAVAVLVPAAPAAAKTVRDGQWFLDSLRIAEAQKLSTGRGVVVAVVDSGVYAAHPDLAGQIVAGTDLTGGGGDGLRDDDGHGTGMAGLIVARGGGATHALGVAPGAKVMSVRVGTTGKVDSSLAAQGIRFAADHGAKVINLSLGGGIDASQSEREAVAYALSKDVVVVASAGNTATGQFQVAPPANIPGVIAVTGLDQQGQFWSGSAQGPEAVLAGPGKDVVTTGAPANTSAGYSIGQGTSAASAIVSGVAALVRAKYPNLDAANVINRMIRTADDAGIPGRDTQYGFGRLNALRALSDTVPAVTTNPLGNPMGSGASASMGIAGSPGRPPSVAAGTTGGGMSDSTQKLLFVGGLLAFVGLIVAFVVIFVRRVRRVGSEEVFEQRAGGPQRP